MRKTGFVTTVALLGVFLIGASAQVAAQDEDKKAITEVIKTFEKAVADLDFDKADAMIVRDARWIEDSYPWLVRQWPQFLRDAKAAHMRIVFNVHDMNVQTHGATAWVTLTLDGTFMGNTDAAKALLGGKSEWRLTFVESEVLIKTREGWRIVLGHTTRLPENKAK